MKLPIKVVPKSSCNGVVGWMGDVLKVCVTVAPERGKANLVVQEVLAEALSVTKGRVRLVTGMNSPWKMFEIDGVNEAEARRRIGRQTRGASS